MKILRALLVCVLAAVPLVAGASSAWAHTPLVSSSPAAGATLAAAPAQVELTFGEPVTLPEVPISVTGPAASTWDVGPFTLTDSTVTAQVKPAGPAGQYTVRYSVIATDGDPISGELSFTLSQPADAPPAAAPDPGPGVPVWVWVLIAVAVLGGGAALALRARRRA